MTISSKIADLVSGVGQALKARGLTLAAAESCTGGMLLSRLIDVAGSSAYVAGGVVCYSNAVKEQLVGVQHDTLLAYGAVSEPTAREMAAGIRHVLKADIGIGITGIAGPDGGTADKPVGLTFIGMATAQGTQVARFVWDADRVGNRELSVAAALEMVLAALPD
jgi:nicotinamide-nucleotide amidase